MKNVTPSPGQVWEHKKTNMSCMLNEVNIDYNDPVSLHKHFTFQPQNDLEWLAVKVESLGPHIKFIARRGSEYLIFESKPKHTPGVYARQQWQNSRYYLGLDEKPQKDTKMIDLRTAKIGDEYINTGSSIVTMVMMSDNEHQFVGKVGQSLSLYNKEGKNHDDSCNDLVSKHDPRHWLKDLPDADIFDGEWLACETFDCEWYLYQGEPMLAGDGTHFGTNGMFALGLLSGIKMPKLKGDEWKLSKISIPDLKAWQEQNK